MQGSMRESSQGCLVLAVGFSLNEGGNCRHEPKVTGRQPSQVTTSTGELGQAERTEGEAAV